jgi:hypothetical protein
VTSQRGTSALVTALALVVLVGFVALALDAGRLMVTRTRLHGGCDAAALAAAAELDGTSAGLQRARARAVDYAARHVTEGSAPIALWPEDVLFGAWEGTPGALVPIPELGPASELRRINAVRVRAGREASRQNALARSFPGLPGGGPGVDVRAEAVARGGGACSGCSVPLVVNDCRLVTSAGLACGAQFTFTTSTLDDIGFTTLLPNQRTVSTTEIIAALGAGCRTVRAGDVLGLGNGNNLTKQVIDAFNARIAKHGTLASVPVVHAASCPARMAGVASVVGFATFRLSGLKGAPRPSLTLTVDCTQATRSATGCGYFGVRSPPELVR